MWVCVLVCECMFDLFEYDVGDFACGCVCVCGCVGVCVCVRVHVCVCV